LDDALLPGSGPAAGRCAPTLESLADRCLEGPLHGAVAAANADLIFSCLREAPGRWGPLALRVAGLSPAQADAGGTRRGSGARTDS
jgi:hypothetical protein